MDTTGKPSCGGENVVTWDNLFCIPKSDYRSILYNAQQALPAKAQSLANPVKAYASFIFRGLLVVGKKTKTECDQENKYLYNGWCAYCKLGYDVTVSGACCKSGEIFIDGKCQKMPTKTPDVMSAGEDGDDDKKGALEISMDE